MFLKINLNVVYNIIEIHDSDESNFYSEENLNLLFRGIKLKSAIWELTSNEYFKL